MEFRMKFIRGDNGMLQLRFAHPPRIAFALMLILVVAAMVSATSLSVVGVIFSFITLFGMVFDDSWTWNPASGQLIHRSGTIFIAKKTIYTPADIEQFEVRQFIRGRMSVAPGSTNGHRPQSARPPRGGSRMIRLGFNHPQKGLVTMESHKAYTKDDLIDAAKAFADAMGKPLVNSGE